MTQDFNPYRPPTATIGSADGGPSDAAAEQELAGRWRRFLTWVVDYLGFMFFAMVIGVVLGILGATETLAMMHERGWSYLAGFVIMSGYYLLFEGLWGRTPGKVLLGTRVVSSAGGRPGFGAILGRTLARFVPFEGLTFFGERGFHDRVSNTRVVRTR